MKWLIVITGTYKSFDPKQVKKKVSIRDKCIWIIILETFNSIGDHNVQNQTITCLENCYNFLFGGKVLVMLCL